MVPLAGCKIPAPVIFIEINKDNEGRQTKFLEPKAPPNGHFASWKFKQRNLPVEVCFKFPWQYQWMSDCNMECNVGVINVNQHSFKIRKKLTLNAKMSTGEPTSAGSTDGREKEAAEPSTPQLQEAKAPSSSDSQSADSIGGDKAANTTELTPEGWMFTDRQTGISYLWSTSSEQWVPKDTTATASASTSGSSATAASMTTPSLSASENMSFVNGAWIFTDPATKRTYRFDDEKKDWVPCNAVDIPVQKTAAIANDDDECSSDESEMSDCEQQEGEDDFQFQLRLQQREERRSRLAAKRSTTQASTSATTHGATYRDPKDGSMYEWDASKKAWIPKIDEDFLALYQANYGLTPLDTTALEKEVKATADAAVAAAQPQLSEKELKMQRRRDKRNATQQQKSWFDIDNDHNTNVYVSGLPFDITPKEFEDFMSKCGLIAKDEKNQLKLKLYTDDAGGFKGDGRCCYIKRESVELALNILDESEIKPGHKVHVEVAHFAQKGDFDPSKRKKISAKAKKKMKERQEKLFDWRPDKLRGERGKFDNVVVIKNLFDPKEFYGKAELMFDLQELLKKECSKHGEIKKVMIFDNNPEGVASLTFADPSMADNCLTMTDYRLLRGRQVRAERWDGRTKYKIEETDEQRAKRIKIWEQELEKHE